MLEIIGIIVIVLSYLTAAVVNTKYKIRLDPAYWYLWGSISMGVGFLFILS